MSTPETVVGPAARTRSTSRAEARGVSAETVGLVAFAALLVLTGTFGREFSKLSIGPSWLHPTELLLLAVAGAAVIHLGPRAAFDRIRATGVLIPLLVLWLFGAIATIRGLNDWGFSLVLHDVGLVEYSVIIPLVAMLVSNRDTLRWLVKALVVGGLAGLIVQAAALWTPLQWDIGGRLGLVSVASGLYISIYVGWVASRRAAAEPVAWWEYALSVLGVAMVVIGVARAAWLGLVAALVVAIVLATPGRRLVTVAAIGAVLVAGALLSIPAEKVQFGHPPTASVSGEGSEGAGTGEGKGSGPSVVGEVTASFDLSGAGGQGANSSWRLAYWEYMLEASTHNPLGVGFGTPSAFTWSGVSYDRRTGDPADPFDVTSPHNSFVNILYRTGVIGLLALAAILAITLWRLVRFAANRRAEDRAIAVWLIGLIASTAAVASLSAALEGPFLGIFFWTAIGLGLVAPSALADGGGAGAKRVDRRTEPVFE